MNPQPTKKNPHSNFSNSQSSQVLVKNPYQGQVKERAFEITLYGRFDYRSETDLAEAKAMLREIAYEIKQKFNRGAFVSRHNDYAAIDEAETEICASEEN